MATFYSSPTDQTGAMPTLYLKEPRQMHHLDPSAFTGGSVQYMNYPSLSAYSDLLAGNAHIQQNCDDLPGSTTMISQHSSMVGPDLVASRLGETAYHTHRDGRNEEMFLQTMGGSTSGIIDFVHSYGAHDPHMGLQRQIGDLNGQNLSFEHASTGHGQGLSLSLSTKDPVSSSQYPTSSSDVCRDDNSTNRLMDMNLSPYALSNIMSTIPNSRYVKAAQQLLDEVVHIQMNPKQKAGNGQSTNTSFTTGVSKNDGMPVKPQESTANPSVLSPSERQDHQNKLTKLLAMLDEVDRRYKQYYHQMQIVVSSFDVLAGRGAAKPYTSLALQTISQHFRSLRDAINGQIRSTRHSLGEQDSSSSKGGVLTRLRYIDQHLRTQKAVQQLGMFQQHAWRPQRGLPENSVSILRAWLFEHFLHPYPSDSEKLMLARQTGLTRSQISNWFINARVRLWKPMIEDIYKEEIGDTEIDSNSSSDNTPKGREESQSFTAGRHHSSESTKFNHISNLGVVQNNATSSDPDMNMKMEQRLNEDDHSPLHNVLAHSDGNSRFMVYQMNELGKYESNDVSLTLGLQHCEGVLPVSSGQHGFLMVGGESMYGAAPPLGPDVADYECMTLTEQRHRFGPPHMLHDFVA